MSSFRGFGDLAHRQLVPLWFLPEGSRRRKWTVALNRSCLGKPLEALVAMGLHLGRDRTIGAGMKTVGQRRRGTVSATITQRPAMMAGRNQHIKTRLALQHHRSFPLHSRLVGLTMRLTQRTQIAPLFPRVAAVHLSQHVPLLKLVAKVIASLL